MSNWIQLGILGGLLVWLLIANTRPTLVIFGVFVGLIGIIIALDAIKQRLPKVYGHLQSIGYLAVAALIAIIVVGGLLRTCSNPESCTANEARFGGCD